MLEPLKQFICDTCGGVIKKPEDGWVEWISKFKGNQAINTDFRICHHTPKCMVLADYDNVCDNHLNNLLKDESIVVQLLDMLSSPKLLPAHPRDIPGIVEMLRRFTIPYYEEAKQYLNKNEYSGAYDYLPQNLKAIIDENT